MNTELGTIVLWTILSFFLKIIEPHSSSYQNRLQSVIVFFLWTILSLPQTTLYKQTSVLFLSQSLHCRCPVRLIIMINKWNKHTRCFLHEHLDFTILLPAFIRPFPVNISIHLAISSSIHQRKQCSKFPENFKNNGPIRTQCPNQKLVC